MYFFFSKKKEVHRLVVTGNEICSPRPTSLKIQLLLCGAIMANFFLMFKRKDQKRSPKFNADLLNIHVQLYTLGEKALLVSLPSNDKFLNHEAFQKLHLFPLWGFYFILHFLFLICSSSIVCFLSSKRRFSSQNTS